MTLALWKIIGQSDNGNTGGYTEVYVLTPTNMDVPDPHAALDFLNEPRSQCYTWHILNGIEFVGHIPAVWRPGDTFGDAIVESVAAGSLV